MCIVRYEVKGGVLASECAVDGGRVIREGGWLFTVEAVDGAEGRLIVWQGGDYMEVLMMGESAADLDQVELIDAVQLPLGGWS